MRCKKVYLKTGIFQSSKGNVRVQTTINYFNYTGNFIHDAAVTWVEKVNLSSFDVCALKAGRLDRLTPDDGLTFIDFIAFQEAPKSASAGQVVMPNWWDGTQCESVTFEVSLNPKSEVNNFILTMLNKLRHDLRIFENTIFQSL